MSAGSTPQRGDRRDLMQIDFWIDYPCEPKRKLGVDGLRARLRDLSRLDARSGVTEDEATRALEAGFALRPLAFHCGRCPANVQRREFGCIGTARLPLSGTAEAWLMGLLPESLKPAEATAEQRRRIRAIRELLRWLRDHRAGASNSCEALVERAEPATRSYGFFLWPDRVSSRQLLQLLLFNGELGPLLAETILRALGVWADGPTGMDGVPEAVFTQPVSGSDDPSVAALKRLFLALIVACSLEVGMRSAVTE